MQWKNYKWMNKAAFFIFCLAFSFSCFAQKDSVAVKHKVTHSHDKYYTKPRIDVNDVIAYMDSIGIKHSEVVIKQALLETGHFRARLLMDRNNLFAFRFTKHYMRFSHWEKSVDYYKNWQDRFYTNDKEDYYLFLKRVRYARAKNYINVLKQVRVKKN